MENQIVGQTSSLNKKMNVQPNWISWISLIILWLGICSCWQNGSITDIRVIISTALLLMVTVVHYFNFDLAIKITLGIIILGVFQILKFFPAHLTFSFEFGGLAFGFNGLAIIIGIIHFTTNWKLLSKFYNKVVKNELTEEEAEIKSKEKISLFKNRFLNKSDQELNVIINNEKLLPEAINAAKELLSERR